MGFGSFDKHAARIKAKMFTILNDFADFENDKDGKMELVAPTANPRRTFANVPYAVQKFSHVLDPKPWKPIINT